MPPKDATGTAPKFRKVSEETPLVSKRLPVVITPAQQPKAPLVYGAIKERYDQLGGPSSWLGLPLTDEQDFADGGRFNSFQNGEIYWWPDVGAIEVRDVVVHYTGLICFGETDWDQTSGADEPYVIMGVISHQGSATHRSQIYEDVDSGDRRPDLIEIYRGKPWGLAVHTVLMEHDMGDPDKYKGVVTAAVTKAGEGVTKLVAKIPIYGPPIAAVAEPVLTALVPAMSDAINGLLDTGDDNLGQSSIVFSPKQMVVLATRVPNSWSYGVGYKAETGLFSSDGATYKAYFGLIPA